MYNDTTCTTIQSTVLLLTETCVSLDTTSSIYASSSGELKAYQSVGCTGSANQTVKLDTCANADTGIFVKTS